MKNIHVIHSDEAQIYEKLKMASGALSSSGLQSKGWVRAYLHKKNEDFLSRDPDVDGPNLICAKGREFAAQKLFEVNAVEDATLRPRFYDYKVSHFGVGCGGATVTGLDATLLGPMISDSALYKPISLGDETYGPDPSKYSDSNNPIITFKNAVKPIATDGIVYLEPMQYENSPDYYTKVKCTCVVPLGEPSALDAGGSIPISEAALYFVNSAANMDEPQKYQLFSHICFPPKWKAKEDILTIFWYILF